jgi:competence protein ComEC
MSSLKISVLNVGHGDFIYAETPLGNNLVIDCGSDGGDVSPAQFLSKVSKIDELQISHPHTDHFGDILAIGKKKINSFRCMPLEEFTDKTIGWKDSDLVKINKLRMLKKNISSNDDAVPCNSNFSHSVYPPTDIDYANPNTASYVTILSYAGIKILFGGDLPDSGWLGLLKQENFRNAIKGTTIFKVPHHGRKEGCSEELFKYISPKLCIISDKPIDETNKNTVATNWYTSRSIGAKVVNYNGTVDTRKVLSTRNDGSIFVEVSNNGSYTVYLDTKWRA